MKIGLTSRHSPGASVEATENGWRLEIPTRSANRGYCLAQLDDYTSLPRGGFIHSPPWELSLRARVSQAVHPGTWGFGLWNDPFGLSFGFGGEARRLPVLPNAAWFFYASPPSWLSLHDSIPGQGFFTGTVRSPHTPSIFLAPAILGLAMTGIKPVSRLLRQMVGGIIQQDACLVSSPVTEWHCYSINWLYEICQYSVDGRPLFSTRLSPSSPLGLVIWIDNQYAVWDARGRFGYGTLENPPAWLEISELKFS